MYFRSRCGQSVVAIALATGLSPFAEARQPTEFEQYQLELINRTRLDPVAEVTRLSGLPWGDDGLAMPDLNEGLPAGTITAGTKQPLAFNLDLIDAASDYSDTLLINDAFSHTFGGTTASGRMTTAGYMLTPSFEVGENLAVTGSTGSHPVNPQRAEGHHNNLFIDDNVAGRGHRTNLLDAAWREIGIGIRAGSDYDFFQTQNLNAVITTQDFAFTSEPGHGPFLTGVAYNDIDVDGFYTPDTGESLGNLVVQVFQSGTDTLVGSTNTYDSGGYAISLTNGTYDVLFSGTGISKLFSNVDLSSGQNIKLDAINPIPEPSSMAVMLVGIAGVGCRRRRYR